jgi:hypothetical protein
MSKYKHFNDADLDGRNLSDPTVFDHCYGASVHFHKQSEIDRQGLYHERDPWQHAINYGAKLLYVAHLLGFKIRADGFILNGRGEKQGLDDILRALERKLKFEV